MIYSLIAICAFILGGWASQIFWWKVFVKGVKEGSFDKLVDDMRMKRRLEAARKK